MFRKFIFAVLIIAVTALSADPEFVPVTQVAEDFCVNGDTGCGYAASGLDVLLGNYTTSEFINLRYFLNSGTLSNADVTARADYYNVTSYPTVVFNGSLGHYTMNGPELANGDIYDAVVASNRFGTSPVKINTISFIVFPSEPSITVSCRVNMIDSLYVLNNQSLRFVLLENDVSASADYVVRAVHTQPISLSGAGSYLDLSSSFILSPTWNTDNLWFAFLVQQDNQDIIQAASTLPQPQYQVRAAFDWNRFIVGPNSFNYISEPVWFYNMGVTENFTIKLIKDDGPADWYLNFCDEDGLCYPGNIPLPFSLNAGEVTAYHLNLFIGSSGTAHFRFVIESDNIPDYEISFSYQTDDTSIDDSVMPVSALSIMHNYPNPFSGTTVFRINAKTASRPVQIDIYNTKGQKVSSLLTPALKAGQNEISWQTAGSDGKPLPSGIYFAGLKDSPGTLTKLLLINK